MFGDSVLVPNPRKTWKDYLSKQSETEKKKERSGQENFKDKENPYIDLKEKV